MATRYFLVLLAACCWLCAGDLSAAEKLKALYVTGGGYHDYEKLAPLLTEGIAKTANVSWDIQWAMEALRKPDFGKDCDAIVYNFCFSDEKDAPLIERLLKITRDGKPTLLVHCSMHCFMASDAWTECCGQRTRRHDAYRAFATEKMDADHPVMKGFPDHWKTKGDELYQTIEFAKDSHALLKAKSEESGKDHVVCWTHDYGKGRVFATTLGHDMNTAAQDDYHKLLANGLLWACDKLDDAGKPKDGYGAAAEKTNDGK